MSDIAKVVEKCLHIKGLIRLKPYIKLNCEYLSQCVLWDYIRTNKHQVTVFGDDCWYSQGNKLSVTFYGIKAEYQYQLKAMTIGMYTQGSGEGMDPLSWASIIRIITTLKHLAKWFQRYQINSFSDFQSVPELKLRNIIIELVRSSNLQKHPSFAQSIFSAIHWIKAYGLVKSDLFFELINEYFMPFTLIISERRNKHSIIPVQIMKQVLNTCEKHILEAEDIFDKWGSRDFPL